MHGARKNYPSKRKQKGEKKYRKLRKTKQDKGKPKQNDRR